MPYDAPDVTFVTTRSGDPSIFKRNFAASLCLTGIPPSRIIVQEGFTSAGAAYNDAIEKAQTDLIVFCHQDVYFPATWLADLNRSLEILKETDPNWGVLGCSGISKVVWAAYLYSVGIGVLGKPFEQPVAIDTLDEFILILRKSSGLRFDPTIPHFHFYGTDICLSARQRNKNCYAISAFTVHNTSFGPLSAEFYRCYWHIRKKWKKSLPIKAPCIWVTRWNEDYIIRRAKEFFFSAFGNNKLLPRLEDPSTVLQTLTYSSTMRSEENPGIFSEPSSSGNEMSSLETGGKR